MLKLDYFEEQTQRRLSFQEGEVVPLRLDELLLVNDLTEPINFPLKVRDARIESSEFEDIDTQKRYTLTGHLNSRFGSNILALVDGGWLPSGMVLDEEALLLPDRCTIGAIRARFVGGQRQDGQKDDFLDFAADKRLHINPMLYAIEGATGHSIPNAAELSELFDRAADRIRQALPKSVIFPNKSDVMDGAVRLLEDSRTKFEAKQRLLTKLAPLLATSVSRARRRDVWHEMREQAERHGVPLGSLLGVSLFSTASARQHQNPAREVLKPKAKYTAKNAYNALADLRALDLLIAASTDFPDKRVTLLTEDRGLAKFWAGLQVHSQKRRGSDIHYSLNPHHALFASLNDEERAEMWQLAFAER